MSRLRMNYRQEVSSAPLNAEIWKQAYLLAATEKLLHEDRGALLLWRQVDLGYRGSERSPAG